MLSEKTIAIVKATAPVLQEHGEALTRHFYARMFEHNPEVKPFFNMTNQQAGTQQRALAGAVCAYAANIDNLGVLSGAVELIAQKHASLRIKPEHYPIVGENLLASIREVLGDGANDDVIGAWAEAYGVLTDILTGRENAIYQEQHNAPGGWDDFRSFRVARKEVESDIITSLYLAPQDGMPIIQAKAGQYITIRVPTPCGHSTMRNYSLSDKPGMPHYRISVKREVGSDHSADGFVSNWIHHDLKVGDVVEIAPPCGAFFLDTQSPATRPLVLLAGGIGITPILSMFKAAADDGPKRPITLIHANLHEGVQAFRQEIDAMAAHNPDITIRYVYNQMAPEGYTRVSTDITGVIDLSLLQSLISSPDCDFFFCGPKSFMMAMDAMLTSWGVPAAQRRYEFFGPLEALNK